MTALVTGASGFLGGALARRLCADGPPVRILVRDKAQAEAFAGLPVEAVFGSLEDEASLREAVSGVTEIYHCAAASADWAPMMTFRSANDTGVANILAAAREVHGLRRFLHVSTTDVYGYPKTPMSEDAALVDFGLPYNSTKVAGERHVWAAAQEGMPVTVIRPATLYGPGDKNFVGNLCDHLKSGDMPVMSGGHSAPGLLYIDNAVEGIIAAARSEWTVGRAYNLRDETRESWRDYLDALADATGAKRTKLNLPTPFAYALAAMLEKVHGVLGISRRPLLTRHLVLLMSRDAAFPIDRARADFGFRSTVSFAEGVRRSARWAMARDSAPGRAAR